MAIKMSRTFLLRKLHQITGIVPLGLFYFAHLFTNSKAMNGGKVFNEAVEDLHHTPFLLFIEIFGIFLPLVFHSVYGIFISAQARTNVLNYGYERNWFYLFQRITGVFLFFFILFHLLHFRFGLFSSFGLTGTAVAGNADKAYDIVSGDFGITWVLVWYFLGIAATAWHLAYGFFLFAVDWGLIIGENAQKYALYGCLALALGLTFVGTHAAVSFLRPCGLMPQFVCEPVNERKAVERQKF